MSAIARALGISELFVDPLREDNAIHEVLCFRPKSTSAITKRVRKEQEEEVRARRESHEGRLYVVGWMAFDVTPNQIDRVVQARYPFTGLMG
ncbi:MAG: hypothetical protein JNL21_31370 [Myxococcales bacterium]|nr:hypothetical protein [Myxococcales bacterium]